SEMCIRDRSSNNMCRTFMLDCGCGFSSTKYTRSGGLRKFVHRKGEIDPQEKVEAEAALEAARRAVAGGNYDIVVLDEINIALYFNLISLDAVRELIRTKPSHVELILTGRNAPAELLEMADLVTEMKKVKHPFDRGIGAREGIEY
ncbi:MAG: cob(I)yrinic acid a,c-diamide adenosyltransferase, partial [Dehalococcoidales bacterium]|nr:cob(I)yrinic acid a,c-diamide adenosyltransferase [Dehalococcoidales bacterium]